MDDWHSPSLSGVGLQLVNPLPANDRTDGIIGAAVPTPVPPPVLELLDATVVKDGVRVLDGLTWTIHAGQHTAIVGPNGAGKSVLVRVLMHDDRPLARPEGPPPVRVFGEANWNVFDLRSRLGVVSADLHHRFVNGNSEGMITGERAVVSAFLATHGIIRAGAVTAAMRERAAASLALMGAEHLARQPLHEMSSGEARRVLLARALVTGPRALLLDEPTAGLDLVARHRFMEQVRQVARAGTTLILVTHYVDEIIPEIEQVILLKRGRIAHAGPKHAVLTGSCLGDVFDAPLAVERDDEGYHHLRLQRRF